VKAANREKGIALITSLLVLFLVSAMVIGMTWMVMSDQRLGGNNKDRETAFYGAEAGMEKLTADMGAAFTANGKLTAGDIAAVVANPPTNTSLPNIKFLNSGGASTYQVLFTPNANGDPTSTNATILPPSPYAGMQGLITPFTLSVAAQTINTGAEVKLQRQMQVVAIPVFQFGIYSDSDLAYFNGPNFNFGGRVHTNGNLWLTPAGELDLSDKVTVVGQVIRQYLENGDPFATGGYSGAVYIATSPNPGTTPPGAAWRQLLQTEGSVTGFSEYGAVSTAQNSPTWANAEAAYNGQLQNQVSNLSLTAAALGGITTPISLIRRAVPGEASANQAEFNDQYFSEASLRILIDDYGPSGTCTDSPMMSLDSVTSTTPTDLATLAFGTASQVNTFHPAAPSWLTGAANIPTGTLYPLPTSGAGAAYSSSNGYWTKTGYPTITGCIKIEYQSNPGGAPYVFTDITHTILNLGYTGRDIAPTGSYTAQTGFTLSTGGTYANPGIGLVPTLPANTSTTAPFPAQGPTSNPNVTSVVTCPDPSPQAIIRLARVRDNPSWVGAGVGCGTLTGSNFGGTDFWPNTLYDARESMFRQAGATQVYVHAQGVMNYVELDAANLATWLANHQSGMNIDNATTGFTVYFSDRRGEQPDTQGGTNTQTGSVGYNNFINPNDATNGCPNGVMDPGEDLEGDAIWRTYGGAETPPVALNSSNPSASSPVNVLPGLWNGGGWMTTVLAANPLCGGTAPNRPDVYYTTVQQARENPPVFFRHALKIVDGGSLNFGTSCGTVACGISIVAENPVYVQGDFNAPANGTWTGQSVAAAIAGDAVSLLSDNWNDANSFAFPYSTGQRLSVQTAYRAAMIAGKGIPFPEIGGIQDFGTDGGVHNFLRYLEGWGTSLYYEGSLVSFYYNRQATGTYKGGGVYGAPTRHYTFDTNFTLGPQYLPPNTPMLRSVNTTGFSQQLLPSQ
jgi:hypothetical protein